jgi:hypothetical protein
MGWHHVLGDCPVRGRERGGPSRPVDGAHLVVARDRWARVAWCGQGARLAEPGGGKGADRWATATMSGSGTS